MGRGLISVVAPRRRRDGRDVPVVYDLVRGERPGIVVLVGLVTALVAVASSRSHRPSSMPAVGIDAP